MEFRNPETFGVIAAVSEDDSGVFAEELCRKVRPGQSVAGMLRAELSAEERPRGEESASAIINKERILT